MIKKLEAVIETKKKCLLVLKNGKKVETLPHKIVYLEGELCLVGEEIGDSCLVTLSLSNISSIEDSQTPEHRGNYCSLEIDDFISAIRAVTELEERLVLKITDPSSELNLNPSHQYLGNPYVTSNALGEIIWAASVEKNEQLYEWLYELKGLAIVLDPDSIKEGLAEYSIKRDKFKREVA